MATQRFSDGCPVFFPQVMLEFAYGFLRRSYNFAEVYLRFAYDFPIVFPWFSYSFLKFTLGLPMVSPIVFLWLPSLRSSFDVP